MYMTGVTSEQNCRSTGARHPKTEEFTDITQRKNIRLSRKEAVQKLYWEKNFLFYWDFFSFAETKSQEMRESLAADWNQEENRLWLCLKVKNRGLLITTSWAHKSAHENLSVRL